jgi:hypothetical protein
MLFIAALIAKNRMDGWMEGWEKENEPSCF